MEGKPRTDGTADLVGHNLPVGAVAIACAKLDAFAHWLKRAGYPGTLDHLRTDIYLGKLANQFPGFTDDEIFDALMTMLDPHWADDLVVCDGDTDVPGGYQPTEPGDDQPSHDEPIGLDQPSHDEPIGLTRRPTTRRPTTPRPTTPPLTTTPRTRSRMRGVAADCGW